MRVAIASCLSRIAPTSAADNDMGAASEGELVKTSWETLRTLQHYIGVRTMYQIAATREANKHDLLRVLCKSGCRTKDL